jgi:hypothetical protein
MSKADEGVLKLSVETVAKLLPELVSQRLSGNKAFIREDLMSHAGQG